MDRASPKSDQGIIELAIAARDSTLLRKIAVGREGLTDQQRQALALMADLLDRAADKHGGQA